ncbi:hypothetical protein MTO96_014337 [Rhipicephalus appendiculatus]
MVLTKRDSPKWTKTPPSAKSERHSSDPATLEDVNSQQAQQSHSSLCDSQTERLSDSEHSICTTAVKVEKSPVATQAERHSSCPATFGDGDSQQAEQSHSSLCDPEAERLSDSAARQKLKGVTAGQQLSRMASGSSDSCRALPSVTTGLKEYVTGKPSTLIIHKHEHMAGRRSGCVVTLEDVNSPQRQLQSSSLCDYENERPCDPKGTFVCFCYSQQLYGK